MNMNFKRSRFQLYVEELLGCKNPEDWKKFQPNLKEYCFTDDQAQIAKPLLRADAVDLYFKALLSLCKGLNSIYRGYHSWPVVNLYYSCFYSMRSHLSALEIGIVRNKGIFYWTTNSPEHPSRVAKCKVSGDHQSVMKIFGNLVKDDVLSTNSVNGTNVYEWLMAQRNSVQYRSIDFSEPDPGIFHKSLFESNLFESQVSEYISDDIPVYCFDHDHCMLAAPIIRLLKTRSQLEVLETTILTPEKFRAIERLISEISTKSNSKLYQLLA